MPITQDDLKIAIAFARLELLELEHGDRALTQCPGLRKVGQAVAEACRAQGRELARGCSEDSLDV